MDRKTEDQLAKRVAEAPKRSPLPYFAVAIVSAVAFWSMQQISEVPNPPKEMPDTTTTHEESEPRGAQGEMRTLFSADDYPADAQRNGEEGTVQAELAVDTRGRVSGCKIVRTSGHILLDKATCRILQRRARFAPALDVNGDPVADTVRTPPIVWRLEG